MLRERPFDIYTGQEDVLGLVIFFSRIPGWDKNLTPSKGRKTLPLQSYEGLIRLRGYSCNNYSALLFH